LQFYGFLQYTVTLFHHDLKAFRNFREWLGGGAVTPPLLVSSTNKNLLKIHFHHDPFDFDFNNILLG
jgi:hypothetical protein